MKASERLAERNDILGVLFQADSDLAGLKWCKGGRQLRAGAAIRAAELLDIRAGLVRELNALGFQAPELDGRFNFDEGGSTTAGDSAGGVPPVCGGSVVARRRLGPPGAGA